MRDEAKAEEMVDQLREAFAQNIRTAMTGLPAHQALQLADTLCAVQLELLAGLRVSYRAREPIDGEAIAESWRRGLSLREVIAAHGCSRPTAYKYHPGKRTKRAKAG
jgi:hypothetical protein